MAVLGQYQDLYDNLLGLIRILVCVYMSSLNAFPINFIEIRLTFIACEPSKPGIEKIWEIKFETKQVHGTI